MVPVKVRMIRRTVADTVGIVADFYVMTDRLATKAVKLGDLTGQVSAVARDAATIPVTQAAFGRIAEAATLYSALASSIAKSAKDLEEAARRLTFITAGAKECASSYAQADKKVAEMYRQTMRRKEN